MDRAGADEQSAEVLNLQEILRDSLAVAVLAVDATGRICGLNVAAETLTGRKGSDLLQQNYGVLPEPIQQLVDDTLTARHPILERRLAFACSGLDLRLLQASSIFCVDRGGQPSGVLVLINPLDAAQKLESNVQRLDRLAVLGTVSASMAHEIRNAFVAVRTFVDDLVQRNQEAELGRIVLRELGRIDTILSQILKFSGPSKPTLAPLNIHRVLDQCLRLIQPQLSSKQIHLERRLAAAPDLIPGDEYQLEQAFLNMLLNAVAALDRSGRLIVSTETVTAAAARDHQSASLESLLQVTISDTGSGIAPENLPRLFEPFFTTKPHGTGLGLAITRRIINEHGGSIAVESQPCAGTTFRVYLPMARTKSESA